MLVFGFGTEWWKAIGSSLSAAGYAGLVIFVYVLLSDDTARRIRVFQAAGLSNCFAGRSVLIREEYEGRLREARESIDVMGFGLSSLRQDYEGNFRQWAAAARVRVLLLDPDYPTPNASVAMARDLEEGNQEGTIDGDVRSFVRSVRALRGDERFQIRLYKCLPSVNVFRVDDDLFFGPYLMGRPSRNTPTFVCERGGVLFDAMNDHFEKIWSSEIYSRAVPTDWV